MHPVRARRRERAASPAVGRQQQRARVVLEHPACEVAPGPRREAGRRDRRPCAGRRAQERLQRRREPQVAADAAPDGAAVTRRRPRPGSPPAGDGLGRERLPVSSACAMPFAGHRVDDAGRVAHEQHASVREAAPGRSGWGSARHARAPSAAPSGRASSRSVGRGEQLGPQRLQVAARCARRHAARRTRRSRRRRAAGTPTRTRAGGRARRAPRADRRSTSAKYWRTACHSPRSRGDVRFERAPHRRPVPVGGDHVTGVQRLAVAEQELHLVVVQCDLLDRALLADVDAAAGARARRAPRRDRVESRPRRSTPPSSGSGSVTCRPDGETSTVSRTGRDADRVELVAGEPERFEIAQRAGREPVAARLVAGKRRLVDADHRAAVPDCGDRGRDPARPGTDHGDVDGPAPSLRR